MVVLGQRCANRPNALQSTGPKAEEGPGRGSVQRPPPRASSGPNQRPSHRPIGIIGPKFAQANIKPTLSDPVAEAVSEAVG